MGNFSIALSGLNAQNAALSVVSNDLANLNTTGFKGSTVDFQDLVAESINPTDPQNGGGVSVPQAIRHFTQGTLQVTNGAFDGAIQGNGFFIVQNNQGETLYTRAGNFTLDKGGNLVTVGGDFVQGWTATGGILNPSGAVGKIVIPSNTLQKPSSSTQFSADLNLNAAGQVGGSTGSFSTPIQVVDSLGTQHTLTLTFTKTGANAWSYAVTIPGADVSAGTAGTPFSITTGNLTFNSSGQLTSPTSANPVAVKITGLSDGAADMNLNWNLYHTDGTPAITQYAQTSAVSATSQDGVPVAQLAQVTLSTGGQIVAQYSDGSSQIVAQIALASISNPDSLVAVGKTEFIPSATTGTPVVGVANTGGRGQIQSGEVEGSTVDIAKELTNLIIYQSSYQANSRVITTLDQINQVLLTLKQ